MSGFLEADIKENAITNFINLVAVRNKSLGKLLLRKRYEIQSKAIMNIQRIGVHEYAKQVLRPTSAEREQLEMEIERANVWRN